MSTYTTSNFLDPQAGAQTMYNKEIEPITSTHPRAEKFLRMIAQLKTVDWRPRAAAMNADSYSVCVMVEKGIVDPDIIRGQLVLYCEGGKVYRTIWKMMARIYSEAGGQELDVGKDDVGQKMVRSLLLG
jgi:hypothetical protein